MREADAVVDKNVEAEVNGVDQEIMVATARKTPTPLQTLGRLRRPHENNNRLIL
jgi:hypothetical protein